ncbi:MAG: hypothetical protein R2690_06980 [Acidimicrobiales bacterium]
MIDGGMATAIRTPAVLARTWTIYTDVRRITTPLGITDTDDIAVVLLARRPRPMAEHRRLRTPARQPPR